MRASSVGGLSGYIGHVVVRTLVFEMFSRFPNARTTLPKQCMSWCRDFCGLGCVYDDMV